MNDNFDRKSFRKSKLESKKKNKKYFEDNDEYRLSRKNKKQIKQKLEELEQEEKWQDWENEIY